MSSLPPERWQAITRVLGKAFDRPPEERIAYVRATCAGDPELRRQVEALLEAEANAPAFLEQRPPRAVRSLLLALFTSTDRRLRRPLSMPPLRPEAIAEVQPIFNKQD